MRYYASSSRLRMRGKLDVLMYCFELVKAASLCVRFVRSTLPFVSATRCDVADPELFCC